MPARLGTLLEMTLAASAMIAVAAAVRAVLSRRMPPAVMLALWGLVLLRLCLPVTLASPVHLDALMPQPSPAAQEQQPASTAPPAQPAARPSPVLQQGSSTPAGMAYPPVSGPAPAQPAAKPSLFDALGGAIGRVTVWDIVSAAWLAGALLTLLLAAGRALRFRRKLSLCRPVGDEGILRTIRRHRHDMGIRRDIEALECGFVAAPAVFGYFRPRLLIPADFIRRMDGRKLGIVLLHELCHIKRRDMLFNYAWLLAKAVHWFNPLVWAAYRAFQSDVELCRDGMVARALGRDGRLEYGQTLIESARFAGKARRPLPSAAASLFETGSKVKARVLRLVAPCRGSAISVLAASALAALMTFACFTTACQPTPTKPAVVNKGDGKLEEKIHASPVPTAAPTQAGQGGAATGGDRTAEADPTPAPTPMTYQLSFPCADEKVTVKIDAGVTIQGDKAPVVRVRPHEITMEQVKAIAAVLFGDNTLYEPKVGMSKGELDTEILKLQKAIASNDEMLDYYDGDQSVVDEVKADFGRRIEVYQALRKNAPETVERKDTDWTFHPAAYYVDMAGEEYSGKDRESQMLRNEYYDSRTIELESTIDPYYATLEAMNVDTENIVKHSLRFVMGTELVGKGEPLWNDYDARPMAMTRAEAIAMVTDALKRMGIESMQLRSCRAYGRLHLDTNAFVQGLGGVNSSATALAMASGRGIIPGSENAAEIADGEPAYQFSLSFSPSYEGVTAADMSAYDGGDYWDDYGPFYAYEQLNVIIHNGVITHFVWTSPMDTAQVENANVPVLSLEEAVGAFERQMKVEYTLGKLTHVEPGSADYKDMLDRAVSGEIDIMAIRRELMRIRIRDDPSAYRMVPVWVFTGADRLTLRGQSDGNGAGAPANDCTYAVINAIDGSVIDPHKGY